MPSPTIARAAVFHAANQPLVLEYFPIRELKPSEVLVRILCATICGSDLHSYFGRRHSPTPAILGHEMVGEVAGIGPNGALDHHGHPLKLGDRVTWSMVWSCGNCFYCNRGVRPKCLRLKKFGHERINPEHALWGGLAEYCLLPAGTAIFPVPANLSDAVGAPANCATATVAAIFRNAGSVQSETVAIIGAGFLGLTACAMASILGAKKIIAFDRDLPRLQTARQFAATEIGDANLDAQAIDQHIKELTEGHGVDIVIDLAGHPNCLESALGLVRMGGRIMLAGATFPGRPVEIASEFLVRNLITIKGTYNYAPEDLEQALKFLETHAGGFPFASLVSQTFSLSQATEAFHYAESERPFRVAVVP